MLPKTILCHYCWQLSIVISFGFKFGGKCLLFSMRSLGDPFYKRINGASAFFLLILKSWFTAIPLNNFRNRVTIRFPNRSLLKLCVIEKKISYFLPIIFLNTTFQAWSGSIISVSVEIIQTFNQRNCENYFLVRFFHLVPRKKVPFTASNLEHSLHKFCSWSLRV